MKRTTNTILTLSIVSLFGVALTLPTTLAKPVFAGEIADYGASPRLQTMSFYGDTSSQMGFCYTTTNYTNTDLQVVDEVSFKASTGFDDPSLAEKIKYYEGSIEPSKIAGDGFIHRLVATGLTPDTRYVYRFGDESLNAWCTPGTFKTSVQSNRNFSFLHISDPQGDNELHYESYNQLLSDMARDQDPEFIALTGDITDDSHFGKTIDLYEWEMALSDQWSILKDFPVMTVSGNHDGANNAIHSRYNNNVPEGSDTLTGDYYCFDYQGVHFTCINSNDTPNPKDPNTRGISDAQLKWVEADLAAHKDDKFLIVMMHKGMFDAGGHSCNDDLGDYDIEAMRRQLAPMFTKYGVDLVLEGHDHLYNLSYPMVAEEYIGQDSYYHIDDTYKYSYRNFDQFGLKDVYTFSNLEGTFYFNTGTASGQKYYAPVIGGSMEDTIFDTVNPNQKMYTMVDILDNEILLRTYLCTSNETTLFKTYAIAKDSEGTPASGDSGYNTDFVIEGDYKFDYKFSRYNHKAVVSMEKIALEETDTNLAAKFKGNFECDGGLGNAKCNLYRNGKVRMDITLDLEEKLITFNTTGNWHMDDNEDLIITIKNEKDAMEQYVAKKAGQGNNLALILSLSIGIPVLVIGGGLATFFIIRHVKKNKKEVVSND